MLEVRGRTLAEIGGERLRALIGGRPVTVDLGAGDAAFAYRYARAHPERFVIAVDPVRENMREQSARAAKKPERGGIDNLACIVATAEAMPTDLRGIADEVFVTLPWGSLMRGIILGEDAIIAGVTSVCAPGARVRIVLNTRIFDDPVPVEARDLPEVTPEYARETIAPALRRHGLRMVQADWMDPDDVTRLDTSWAKRLSQRRPPRSVVIEATREPAL